MVTVQVVVGGTETTFVLDSGIGLTLVSGSLATSAGCELTGSTYTGPRMSGQEVKIPLGSLGSLAVGGHCRDDVVVGISDIAGLEGVEGFLSLDYFRLMPLTVDYPAGVLVLEDADSVAARAEAGIAVEARVEQDARSTAVFLPLDVPGRGTMTLGES
ncbi:MAG: aspartyl protease family protein [Candidatus Dormibacteria bacterium]